MKVRIIKARLVILILSLMAIISIMSISIKNEADNIDSVSASYKEKLKTITLKMAMVERKKDS